VVNGKLTELIQEYDVEKVQAFLKDVDGDGGDGAEPL
jgi:hypothetical protein